MAKPFIAPTIYHDGVNLYLEWSGHAQRFPFTEGGLSKALKLIPHIASAPGYVTGSSNIATKLIGTRVRAITRSKRGAKELAKATEGQRTRASEILRALRQAKREVKE